MNRGAENENNGATANGDRRTHNSGTSSTPPGVFPTYGPYGFMPGWPNVFPGFHLAQSPFGGGPPLSTGSASTASATGSQISGQRRSPNAPSKLPDADRILLFMIIDYLKRRGFLLSANQLVAESRVDPQNPETVETVHLVETVSHLHGRNPQPGAIDSGFLRDWWGTFWQMYSSRIPKTRPPSNTILSPNQSSTRPEDFNQTYQQQVNLHHQQQQQQHQASLAARRALVLGAMQVVGLAGRDPQTLSIEEQRMVTLAIQQQAAQRTNHPGIVQPPPTSPTISTNELATPSKKKKPDPTPPLTQQQILQIRAAQLQQHQIIQQQQQQQQQQQMLMMMNSSASIPPASSRLIMPLPSTNSPVPAPPPSTLRPSPKTRIKPDPKDLKPNRASPGSGELDETSLLSFFGTPADWFSPTPTSTEGNATWPSSMPVVDQFGNIQVTPTPPSASINPSLTVATKPIKALAKQSSPTLDGRGEEQESFHSEIPALRITTELETVIPPIEAPQPELGLVISDPNDLLLVTEANEAANQSQTMTESGCFLNLIADLGQHLPGTKASSATMSQDGLLMASGGHDKRVLVFSLQQRQLLFVLEGQHSQQITQVRFSSGGGKRLLATASFDKTVHIWDLGEAGQVEGGGIGTSEEVARRVLPSCPEAPMLILKDAHDEPVWSIDFIPTGRNEGLPRLASIDAAGKLFLWDLETGVALHTTTIKTGDDRAVTVRQIKARPTIDGHPAILAIANGSHIELFDCDRTILLASLLVSAPVGDQKGKTVVALNWGDHSIPYSLITATSESVSIWDLELMLRNGSGGTSLTPSASLTVPADKITSCAFLRDLPPLSPTSPRRCAVFGGYQGIYLWEYDVPAEGRPRPTKFPAHEGLVVSLSATRHGPLIIGSASHDGWIKLWQLDSTTVIPKKEQGFTNSPS